MHSLPRRPLGPFALSLSCLALALLGPACSGRRMIDPIVTPDSGGDANVDAAPDPPDVGIDADLDSGPLPIDAAVDPAPVVDALLDVLCDARIRATCASPWDCGCPGVGPRPSVDACAAERVPDCRIAEGESLTLSVAADRVHLDMDALTTCRATLEAAWSGCVPLRFDEVASCRHARVSSVPVGGDCTGPSLCADGAGICDEGGVCVRAPVRDARCETNECAADLVCFSAQCVLPRAEGFACTDHEDCASPLLCLGGFCGAIHAVGEACAVSGECSVDSACTGGTCARRTPATCVDDGGCGNLTSCVRPSVRRCVLLGATGTACADDRSCGPGLACNPTTLVCGGLPALGAGCFSRCGSDLFCDSGTCSPRLVAGRPCPGDSTACVAGLACVAGACAALPATAARCADDRLCAAGLACIDESGGPTCETPHPLGGSCGVASDCASGLACLSGTCAARLPSGGVCFASEDCEAALACSYDPVRGDSRCGPPPGVGFLCGDACVSSASCNDVIDPGACVPDLCAVLVP